MDVALDCLTGESVMEKKVFFITFDTWPSTKAVRGK